MPSFKQQTLNNRVRNANTVLILVGDQEIGFGQTSTFDTNFGTMTLYGIGSAKPQDIQQLKFAPRVTLDNYQLSDTGISILGYPSTMMEVLANNSFNIYMMNSQGAPLITYVGAVAENITTTAAANQPITEAQAFQCMDVLDPTGVSILNSNSALMVAQIVAGALNIAGV